MNNSIHYSSDDEVKADLAAASRPKAYELQDGYPFSMLTDRQFECLLHDIMSMRAGKADKKFGDFDRVLLMQGVGERGRDCALVKNGKHVGVVQCKRYEGLITRPDASREILKFCLHALKDPDLMPDRSGFKYIFVASKDFNELAKTLLNGFSQRIASEKELLAWTEEVISENKSLSKMDGRAVQPELLKILTSIEVIPLGFNELNTLLVGQIQIVERYFSVRKVVDLDRVNAIGEQVEKIARSLTDEDVRRILDGLNAVPSDRRLDLGLFSLWGYPEHFVRRLMTGGQFNPIILGLIAAKSKIDGFFLEALNEMISSEILAQITARRTFAPITITAAAPYLFGKLSERWQKIQQGHTLTEVLPKSPIYSDSASIRANVLKMGEAFFRGDWSQYVGDADMIALKKELARHTYSSFQTIEEMAAVFDAQWPLMLPILVEIERRLEKELPGSTTIILRGLDWFDNVDHVKHVLTTAKRFDPKS